VKGVSSLKKEAEKDKDKKEVSQKANTEATAAQPDAKAKKEEKKADNNDAKLIELQKKLEEAAAQLQTQKEQMLRTLAEYDNYRKRTEKEKAAIYSDATADVVAKFLPVTDNLTRALEQENCSVEDLRKGVEMVNNQMIDALSNLGIAVMGEVGEPFNPDFHNAVSHIEDEKLEENVVSAVFQKGYRIGDKIVRHAMVQVAN
jgi:molecular chaperone GrpE